MSSYRVVREGGKFRPEHFDIKKGTWCVFMSFKTGLNSVTLDNKKEAIEFCQNEIEKDNIHVVWEYIKNNESN